MRLIKYLNHRGSAGLLTVIILMILLMLHPFFCLSIDLKPNTTGYRIFNTPQYSWPVIISLTILFFAIRIGNELNQCIVGLIFSGFVFGVAVVGSWFWEPFLGFWLNVAIAPILQSITTTLRAITTTRIQSFKAK